MTETEWLTCTDPALMLKVLRGKTSDRKLRLFAVACGRLVWNDLPGDPFRAAVEAAEGHAEGSTSDTALLTAHEAVRRAFTESQYPAAAKVADACLAALYTSYIIAPSPESGTGTAGANVSGSLLRRGHGDLAAGLAATYVPKVLAREMPYLAARAIVSAAVRDVFGNPFRPVVPDPSWFNPTVVTLAYQVYEARDFFPLPILADALQDAGCDNTDALDHCRGPGPHARGCWVVDLVLGTS